MTLTLSIFVTVNDQLEISSLFASFQLINTITIPLMITPIFLAQLVGNLVSIKRLQSFLLSSEHKNNISKILNEDINNNYRFYRFRKNFFIKCFNE